MTYEEVMKKAKSEIGPYCKVCPQCNGKACKNQMPGPGAKGVGDVAIRNYDAWKDIRINMDTICENVTPDTSIELFGEKFDYPFFAGPVGAMKLHFTLVGLSLSITILVSLSALILNSLLSFVL